MLGRDLAGAVLKLSRRIGEDRAEFAAACRCEEVDCAFGEVGNRREHKGIISNVVFKLTSVRRRSSFLPKAFQDSLASLAPISKTPKQLGRELRSVSFPVKFSENEASDYRYKQAYYDDPENLIPERSLSIGSPDLLSPVECILTYKGS